MKTYDVAVIGGGAAGLSAAMVLSRARRSVVVVDGGEPRNAPATHMHGFLSRDGMPPAELLAAGRREVQHYGGELIAGRVKDACRDGAHFRLTSDEGVTMGSRRVLVATGLRDELPDIAGLRDRWARDVLHCPYCHGHEVRDRAFGVLGWSAEGARYAQIVRQWSRDVVMFAAPGLLSEDEREQLTAREIGIVEGRVAQVVVRDDALHAVALEDGRSVARDVVFVPPRFVPNNQVLADLGCSIDDGGWVVTDDTGRTTVSGVWAAGNVRNPRAQVITAAGEGSAAAIAINADLVDEDVRDAVRQHRGDTGH
ncbi:MAG: NAD(P)/FAD-dependent oxidoreductase [Nocardioides sp.]